MQDIHPIGNSSGGGGGGSLFAGESTRPSRPHHHDLKCPRCHSFNTKFCYYNNYNLSQPRHFCKSCRRYWTKGGVLRNVPIGGSIRKTKLKPKPNPNPNIVITSSKTVAVEPKQLNSEHSMATLNQSPVEIGSMFQLMETEVKMPEMRSSDQTGDVKEEEGFFYLTGSVDESYWCESTWSDDDGNLNYLC